MSALVLVKHSLPTVVDSAPASTWRLSPAGAARCVALAERLRVFDARAIASSIEPKAVETATLVCQELDLPVDIVEGLHEHDRSGTKLLGDAEYAAAVASVFARPRELVFGRETGAAALARCDAAVMGRLAALPVADDVIVVSHGTVISLFVAAHAGTDGLALWKALGLPSFVVLDRATFRIDRIEGAIA